ncbi:MAG: hypothetical protein WCG21_10795 [Eubacteriales bacterium]
MTTQEQNFSDECVFLYFNTGDRDWGNAVNAAKKAGYSIPENDVIGAELAARAIYNKPEIKTYVENQICVFKEKLSPAQRRTLWALISTMTIGEPDAWCNNGFVNI